MRNGVIVMLMYLLLPGGLLAQAGPERGSEGTFIDPRDGESYAWVRIGGQVWMAENLRFDTSTGSMCWKNREEECASRGRYYTWAAAMKAAPPGWHLPSDEEWMELEMTLGLTREQVEDQGMDRGGSGNTIGAALKRVGAWTTEYQGTPIPVTDETGFSAIPTGWFAQEQFFHEGYTAWWSSTGVGDQAWMRGLHFHNSQVGRNLNAKRFAFTVRCVRDKLEK